MHRHTPDELPKTKDGTGGFEANCDGVHPNLWKFMRTRDREESLIRAEIQQVLGGHPHPRTRNYDQCSERVKNIVNDYQNKTGKYDRICVQFRNISF